MIYINDIPSFRDPEKEVLNFDDRQEKIELIKGVAIQDLGRVEKGDSFSITCLFTEKNLLKVIELWNKRAHVTYKDSTETEWTDMLIVMKSIERDKIFHKYVMATFELWKAPDNQT